MNLSSIVKFFCLSCYLLFSIGQCWLLVNKTAEPDLYSRITQHTTGWIGSHIVLMIAVMLIMPATLLITQALSKSKVLNGLIWLLTGLGVLSLTGQFVIDFMLVKIFIAERETALSWLETIQSKAVIKFLFYDLAACWFLGQLLIVFVLFRSKIYPRWAGIVFLCSLLLLIAGPAIHTLIPRLSYSLLSIALIPLLNFKRNA